MRDTGMVRITSFEIFAVDLPFRRVVAHSAASRNVSDSVFLKCATDTGAVGFGECLPRTYVTGESRDGVYVLLRDRILPKLIGMEFESYAAVKAFLEDCDGKAPSGYLHPEILQTAAWCAVDLALLDAFGHAFDLPVASGPSGAEKGRSGLYSSTKSLDSISLKNGSDEALGARPGFEGEKSEPGRAARTRSGPLVRGRAKEIFPPQSRPDLPFSAQPPVSSGVRCSGVLASTSRRALTKSSLLFRLYGLRQVKMKVGWEGDLAAIRRVRRVLGDGVDLRVDANMAWDVEQASRAMSELAGLGIRCFEQPVRADALDDMSWLVRQTGLTVMADESFSDRRSLERLIDRKACTAVNVRISKCGGLVAALRRCHEARQAGLLIQVGCQVGESSLLSAAQLSLLAQGPQVAYVEGCFGRHLLREDVAEPVLQFGYGGRPPRLPPGPGLGVRVDEDRLRRWTIYCDRIGER
ncbi:MAG: enolase C-terminal domain-like protein [Phycisphaerales bacterium]